MVDDRKKEQIARSALTMMAGELSTKPGLEGASGRLLLGEVEYLPSASLVRLYDIMDNLIDETKGIDV